MQEIYALCLQYIGGVVGFTQTGAQPCAGLGAAGFVQTVQRLTDHGCFIVCLFERLLEPAMADEFPAGIDDCVVQ